MLIPDPEVVGGLRVKVLDFGIAKQKLPSSDALPRCRTKPGSGMGTPGYMAPEQIYGASRVDGRADVYSLGVILYELLSGHRPFWGQDAEQQMRCHLTVAPPALATQVRDAPAPLCRLIHDMLAKQAAERPTMREVLTRLQAIEHGTASPRRSMLRPLRSLAGIGLAGAASLLLLGSVSLGWTYSGRAARLPGGEVARAQRLSHRREIRGHQTRGTNQERSVKRLTLGKMAALHDRLEPVCQGAAPR